MGLEHGNGQQKYKYRTTPCGGYTPCCCRCRAGVALGWAFIGFTCSMLVIFLLPIGIDEIAEKLVDENRVMSGPDVDGYDGWVNGSKDGEWTNEFFFYNVTNPNEVVNDGAKPALAEIGPFVYSYQKSAKSGISWDTDADEVSYTEKNWRNFDREATIAKTRERWHGEIDTDDYVVTTPNIIFLGAGPMVGNRAWKLAFKDGGLLGYNGDAERLFERRKVVELLNGFGLTLDIPGVEKGSDDDDVNAVFPGYQPNNTQYEWVSRIGAQDSDVAQELVSKDGQKEVTVTCPYGAGIAAILDAPDPWCPNDAPCCGNVRVPVYKTEPKEFEGDPYFHPNPSLVRGTDGKMQAKNLQEGDTTWIFDPDMMRAIRFRHTGKEKTFKGIRMGEWVPDHDYIENATIYPPNERVYRDCKGASSPTCLAGTHGLAANLKMAKFGAPIFTSLPHFLYGDPILRNGVTGLADDPQPEDYKLAIYGEPNSGITMVSEKRVQVNVLVDSDPYLTPDPTMGDNNPRKTKWMENVEPVVMPIMWFAEYAMIRDDAASKFKLYYAADSAKLGCLIVGVVGAVASTITVVVVLLRRRQANMLAKQIAQKSNTDVEGALTEGLLSPMTFF